MKTTYLIYKETDGIRQLVAATQKEWDDILKGNRRLPLEKRRCFEMDCFEDGDGLDCMYIEVSVAEHREWNSQNTARQKKRKAGIPYRQLSMDTGASEAGLGSLHESVPSDFDLEGLATDHILFGELKAALRKWKPWAEELLGLYLAGEKRSCTEYLRRKYGLTDRAIRKRKKAFEKFVVVFLKK